MDITFYLQIFIVIFSILDPIGTTPLFLSLTANQSLQEKNATIRRTVITVTSILVISALVGNSLLAFFGIDIRSFQIAGGILLLLLALNMLQAKIPRPKITSQEHEEAIEKEDVSIVPLAIPLLSGPGAISTIIVFASSMPEIGQKSILVGIVIAAALTIWPIFLLSGIIGRKMGQTGLNITVRTMGLILASIGVQFIMEGIVAYMK